MGRYASMGSSVCMHLCSVSAVSFGQSLSNMRVHCAWTARWAMPARSLSVQDRRDRSVGADMVASLSRSHDKLLEAHFVAAWLSLSRPRGVQEQKRRAEKPEGVDGVFRLGQAGRERHTSHDRKGSTSRERGRGQREELESGSRSASGIGDRREKVSARDASSARRAGLGWNRHNQMRAE